MAEPPIKHYPRFLYGRRKKLLRELEKTEFLSAEQTAIRIHGKVIPIPRLQVGYGSDESLSYGFTGVDVPAKKWPPAIEKISLFLWKHLKEEGILAEDAPPPNYVLVNKYVDGDHYIGWHSDKEKDLDKTFPIVSLSLGARRDFCLRLIDNKKHKRVVSLGNGDLVVMLAGMQQVWQHSVPKRKGVTEPRYNLTFRWVV
ncbi:putative alkylated DNA repair protein [Brazilian marseillevirus]|uniref:alkylated DNA repair n=1 Tax=Brazilian marseillevirus TaxID=1813599 RepID=UPI0007828FE8|nr:alkylated DNA repair [Brazilian marseillevirus]AMQ10820.1 putative alkylated DNA repair protein [Brazilian marseillevirus]